MMSMSRNKNPKMAPILFVGMSCLGNALPRISVSVSLPTYLYLGFLILIIFSCMLCRRVLSLYNFAEAD